jgi:S1-C subfamily serine protease
VCGVIRVLGYVLTLVFILSAVMVSPARAQMDPDVADDVAAATVLLSALITQTENGTTTDKQCFLGSGSVISPDGRYILTNNHVVSSVDLATSYAEETETSLLEETPGRQVTVQFKEIVVSVVDYTNAFPDRRYRAEVVKQDEALDLALLRITGDSPGRDHERRLRIPHLALDLGAVQPGQPITLVGYPAFAPLSTDEPGCAPVPADRSIQLFPGVVSGSAGPNLDRLVVTASGSGGMSGGSAVNAAGRLIGIPAKIQLMATGGVVEVIPIERATTMLEEVIPGITAPTPAAVTLTPPSMDMTRSPHPPTSTPLPTAVPPTPTPVPRSTANQADGSVLPASVRGLVIAQGVVDLPEGAVQWRTVRIQAPMPADAPFKARPLGLVMASTGPIRLVDQASREDRQLQSGDAALVPGGTLQQRSSLAEKPISYHSIELVAVGDPAPPDDIEKARVLRLGDSFPAPTGLHNLYLLSDTLHSNETFQMPDLGTTNMVFITHGFASISRPGAEPVALLPGEITTFRGEFQISVSPGGADTMGFVVAIIGPEAD